MSILSNLRQAKENFLNKIEIMKNIIISKGGEIKYNENTLDEILNSIDSIDYNNLSTVNTIEINTTERMCPLDSTWVASSYGNGIYIAISINGAVMKSYDAIEWVQIYQFGVDNNFTGDNICYDIAFGSGIFVIPIYGKDYVMISQNGIDWKQYQLPVSGDWKGITFANKYSVNGIFTIWSTSSDTILYTTDIISNVWQQVTLPYTFNKYKLLYINSNWIFIGQGSTFLLCTTDTPQTWTTKTVPSTTWSHGCDNDSLIAMAFSNTGSGFLKSIDKGVSWSLLSAPFKSVSSTYLNNTWIIIQEDSNAYAYSINEGVSWIQAVLPKTIKNTSFTNIHACNNKFIISTTGPYVYTSTDGITWTIIETCTETVTGVLNEFSSSTNIIQSVAYGNGIFVGVGRTSISNVSVFISYDGIYWDFQTAFGINDEPHIIFNGNYFIIVIEDYATSYYSTDGITWSSSTVGAAFKWLGVTAGTYPMVLAYTDGTSYSRSLDGGVSWVSKSAIFSGFYPIGMIFGNGIFVFFGTGPDILTSTDGDIWTRRAISDKTWKHGCYGDGKYIIFSNINNEAAISTNGTSWSTFNVPFLSKASAYGNNKFVVVSNDNIIYHSYDGYTWFKADDVLKTINHDTYNGQCITFCRDMFILPSYISGSPSTSGQINISKDGEKWTTMYTPNNWSDTCFGKNNFITLSSNNKTVNISTPYDDIKWRKILLDKFGYWSSIEYDGKDLFLAVAENSRRIIESSDGITWTVSDEIIPVNTYSTKWKGITCAYNKSIIIYSDNMIAIRYNGETTWSNISTFTDKTIKFIISYKNLFVVFLKENYIYISSNLGVPSFTELSDTDSTIDWKSVCTNGNIIIGVEEGYSNKAYIITNIMDSVKMSVITLPLHSTWQDITYGDGVFAIISKYNNIILTSSDNGYTWNINNITPNVSKKSIEYIDNIGSYNITDLCYGNGIYAAILDNESNSILRLSYDGINWFAPTYSYPDIICKSITYGADRFVSLGYNTSATLVSSNKGINWPAYSYDGYSGNTNHIIYGKNIFITFNSNNASYMISSDGISWTTMISPSADIHSYTYGNGVFIAHVKNSNNIYWSNDALSWTLATLPTSYNNTYLVHGNGITVMIVNNSNISVVSTNNISWTQYTNLPDSVDWSGLIYGNGIFMACANDTNYIVISENGITWTSYDLPSCFSTITNKVMIYGKDKFIIMSTSGDHNCIISPDGKEWFTSEYYNWSNISYGNGKFFSVDKTNGNAFYFKINPIAKDNDILYSNTYIDELSNIKNGTKSSILTDIDKWVERQNSTIGTFTNIIYGNDKFIGMNSSSSVYLSIDGGVSWDSGHPTSILSPYGGCYGNGKYILVGDNGYISSSEDGITWNNQIVDTIRWQSVAHGNNLYIIIASSGNKILTSNNGTDWSADTVPISQTWQNIKYINNKFFAVSIEGKMISSQDGLYWEEITLPISGVGIGSVAYGNGLYIASLLNSKNILTSVNGTEWISNEALSYTSTCNDIIFANGNFIMPVYNTNMIMTSVNGIDWFENSLTSEITCNNLVYGDGIVILAANTSNILCFTNGEFILNNSVINYSAQIIAKGTLILSSSPLIINDLSFTPDKMFFTLRGNSTTGTKVFDVSVTHPKSKELIIYTNSGDNNLCNFIKFTDSSDGIYSFNENDTSYDFEIIKNGFSISHDITGSDIIIDWVAVGSSNSII